jgi:alpha-galactosidase
MMSTLAVGSSVARRAACLALLAIVSCVDDAPLPIEVGADGALRLRLSSSPRIEISGLVLRLHDGERWLGPAELGAPSLVGVDRDLSYAVRGGALDGARLELRLTPPAAGAPLRIEPRLVAPAGHDVTVSALELSVPEGGVELPGLREQLLFLQHGYQSWSFTGVVRLQAPFAAATAARGETALLDGLGDPVQAQLGVGWWFGLLASAPGAGSLVVGAAQAERWRTAILPSLPAAGRAGLTVRVGTLEERLVVPAGGTPALEPLLLVAGADATATLQRYVAAVAARTSPLRDAPVASPTGWWSWNAFFDAVTEARVLDHAALLKGELEALGFGLVELDDGYEQRWGEWETTDAQRFPSGLSGLAQQVRASGLAFGLWLAPLLVDEQAPLALDHPAWFVQDANGAPLRHTQLGVPRPCLVLDPTHPEAAAHLTGLFQRLSQAGVSLFKLDFLYAGALPGRRHRADVTGIEALRLALQIARAAAPAAHFNLCGMPVLPAVGRGHSLRMGPDVAFKGVAQGFGQLAHEARNVMLRGVLDPLIRNDPDQVLVGAALTLDEARASATLAALTGFYAAGDDLTTLGAERLALLTSPELLRIARRSRSAVPRDLLSTAGDQIFGSPLTDLGLYTNQPRTAVPAAFHLVGGSGEPDLLALFNWSGEAQTLDVDLAALGRAGAAVREIWDGRSLSGPRLSLSLRPHAVALLELTPR